MDVMEDDDAAIQRVGHAIRAMLLGEMIQTAVSALGDTLARLLVSCPEPERMAVTDHVLGEVRAMVVEGQRGVELDTVSNWQ